MCISKLHVALGTTTSNINMPCCNVMPLPADNCNCCSTQPKPKE